MIKEVVSDETSELSIYFNQSNNLVVDVYPINDPMNGQVIKLSKEDALWIVKRLKEGIDLL